MAPKARHTLTIYHHLQRESQCRSCSTVMPGDICFNCGRLSTLLVTPRPPRNLMNRCASAPEGRAPAKKEPVLPNTSFDPQSCRIEEIPTAKETPMQLCPQQCAFNSQVSEADALMDAREKQANSRTQAVKKLALLKEKIANMSSKKCNSSSRACSNSTTSQSTRSLASYLTGGRSGSIAASEILSESGRPYAHVVARWLEDQKPSRRSQATLTERGVDCRINMGGKVCEWVVFL